MRLGGQNNVENLPTIGELMDAFGTKERPVSQEEFIEFWNSLSFKEMEYYKTAKIR